MADLIRSTRATRAEPGQGVQPARVLETPPAVEAVRVSADAAAPARLAPRSDVLEGTRAPRAQSAGASADGARTYLDPRLLKDWIGREAVLHVPYRDGPDREGEVIAGTIASVTPGSPGLSGTVDVHFTRFSPRVAAAACLPGEQVVVGFWAGQPLRLRAEDQAPGYRLCGISTPGAPRDPVLLPSLAPTGAMGRELDVARERETRRLSGVLRADVVSRFPPMAELVRTTRAQAAHADDPFDLVGKLILSEALLPAIDAQAQAMRGARAATASRVEAAFDRMNAPQMPGVHETLVPDMLSDLRLLSELGRVCAALCHDSLTPGVGRRVAELLRRSEPFRRAMSASDPAVDSIVRAFLRGDAIRQTRWDAPDLETEPDCEPFARWEPSSLPHWGVHHFERVPGEAGAHVQLRAESLRCLEETRGVFPGMQLGSARGDGRGSTEGEVASAQLARVHARLVAVAIDARLTRR